MRVLTLFSCFFIFISLSLNAQQSDQEATTLTKIGQKVPSFSFQTLDGKTVNINNYKGKTILINFFATWCPPCMKELPEVEEYIWKKYKDKGLVILAFGRGHSPQEIKAFKQKKGFTFNIFADPKKDYYNLFASKYIPRNFLINKKGEIIFQCVGFKDEDFKKLDHLINKELNN